MKLKLAMVLILPMLGCGNRPTISPSAKVTSPPTSVAAQNEMKPVAEESKSWTEEEKRIVEIARKAVSENDSWVDRAEFRKPERQTDGSWDVLVTRVPYQSGGQRYISIDADGKVMDYGRGL